MKNETRSIIAGAIAGLIVSVLFYGFMGMNPTEMQGKFNYSSEKTADISKDLVISQLTLANLKFANQLEKITPHIYGEDGTSDTPKPTPIKTTYTNITHS
jgi:hypothetical protein